jgi:hypothetical protein
MRYTRDVLKQQGTNYGYAVNVLWAVRVSKKDILNGGGVRQKPSKTVKKKETYRVVFVFVARS